MSGSWRRRARSLAVGAAILAGRGLSASPAGPAARLLGRDPLVSDTRLLDYVNLVGQTVASRDGAVTPYRFAVTASDAPYCVALPEGIVAISRGELRLMGSEAELAVELARGVCRLEAARAGAPGPSDLEADACGARRAQERGYDVSAYVQVLETFLARAASARQRADLESRISAFRALPEARLPGRTLVARFRTNVIL